MSSTALVIPPRRVLWHHGPARDVGPALVHPVRAEVLVVGAGIAGLTAAVELARRGVEVVVLEGRTVGEGTTGLSSAKVTALHGTTYQAITRQWDRDVATQYAAANLAGLEWFRDFASSGDDGSRWEVDRAFTFALDEAEHSTVAAEAEAASDAGLPVDLVADAGLPFSNHGAVVLADQGRVDPRQHLGRLVAAFEDAGGRLFERTRVTGVHREGGEHRVETEGADAAAEQVLITTGLPILDRVGAFARTTCERSYVVAVRAEHQPDGMFLSAGDQPVSLRRARDPGPGEPVLLVGGEGHVAGREPDTVGCYQRLVAWAQEHVGATEVVASWSTQDRKSADHLPYVGAVRPGASSVRVATAFGKWGMTNGTVAGLVLAAQALDEPSPWSELFDAGRLGPARSLTAVAHANAEVAGEMAVGWAGGVLRREHPSGDDEGRVVRHGLRPVAESVVDGRARCLGAVCPHLGGIVEWNAAERSWDCPLHASRFGLDGEVLDGPAVRPLPTVDDDQEPRVGVQEGGGMRTTEITIDAPVEQVFVVVAEPRTYPRWLRGARRVREVEHEWPEAGSSFHHEVGVAPFLIHDTTTVREASPPTLLDLKARARPAGVAHVRFELEALAGDTTRVVLHEQPESGPGRVLWALGGRLWMSPLLGARNESSLSRLKQVVEGGGALPG